MEDIKNTRRLELIRKNVAHTINLEEAEELRQLQEEADAEIHETMAPILESLQDLKKGLEAQGYDSSKPVSISCKKPEPWEIEVNLFRSRCAGFVEPFSPLSFRKVKP